MEGDGRKIKSLFVRGFRQRVRIAQNWQHFTNELILQNESQAPQFIVFRELEIQKKVEGNSNEFPPKSGA